MSGKKERLKEIARTLRRAVAAIAIVICVMPLVSCGTVDYFSTKEKDEILEHFREKLSETSVDNGETVYWTKNGGVYHLFEDCRFLSESSDVRSGKVTQSGRTNVCAQCEKARSILECETDEIAESVTESVAESTSLETETVKESDDAGTGTESESEAEARSESDQIETVYWTQGGSVWHTDRNCGALSRANEVLSGTVEESGKQRKCKLCP